MIISEEPRRKNNNNNSNDDDDNNSNDDDNNNNDDDDTNDNYNDEPKTRKKREGACLLKVETLHELKRYNVKQIVTVSPVVRHFGHTEALPTQNCQFPRVVFSYFLSKIFF